MSKVRLKSVFYLVLLQLCLMIITSCGMEADNKKSSVDFSKLQKTESLMLRYANQFSADKYGEYWIITIGNKDKQNDVIDEYIIVPEGCDIPYNLPDDMTVIKMPLDHTYLLSTSVMDLIDRIGKTDCVNMVGTKENDWYLDSVKSAFASGDMMYAGKYSAPDYELLLNSGCNLAIANTMIYHKPESKEKLQELGIPVLVEKSSYETHPLGRLEWIKLYGIIYDVLDIANNYYDEQINLVSEIVANVNNEKKENVSIAVFSVTTNGSITVRKPGDYIAKMIELAGGEYALSDYLVEEENSLSTMNIQMEDFYKAASQADILIYNSTIEGEIRSLDDIAAKNDLFKEFKAYKSGEVYCTSKNFFQESTGIGEFIVDLNKIISGNDDCTYLNHVN